MNLFQALDTGYNILKSIQKNSYKIDTELLLCDSLNISRENLILNLNILVLRDLIISYRKYKEEKQTNQLHTY